MGAGFPGNVYYAMHSNHAEYGRFLADYDYTYPDGSTAVQTSIQAAVNSCENRRGDTIVVMPPSSTTGKWKENVIVDKSCVHIFSAAYGWEMQFRPGDATPKYPLVGNISVPGFSFLVMARSVEIAGFLFDGGGGYGGVYVGDGVNVTGAGQTGSGANSASAWIHHNQFRGGNEGTYGLALEGCSANVVVEDNTFDGWDNASIWFGPGGGRTVQQLIIRRNSFLPGDGATQYGITCYAAATNVGTLIDDNKFRDGAGTFTQGLYIPAGNTSPTAVTDNKFACSNEMDILATDIHSGNTKATLSATEVFVDED